MGSNSLCVHVDARSLDGCMRYLDREREYLFRFFDWDPELDEKPYVNMVRSKHDRRAFNGMAFVDDEPHKEVIEENEDGEGEYGEFEEEQYIVFRQWNLISVSLHLHITADEDFEWLDYDERDREDANEVHIHMYREVLYNNSFEKQ